MSPRCNPLIEHDLSVTTNAGRLELGTLVGNNLLCGCEMFMEQGLIQSQGLYQIKSGTCKSRLAAAGVPSLYACAAG